MKHTLLVSLSAVVLLAAACVTTTPQDTAESARIARVESGLLPGTVTKGQNASMKLADRMAFHKVPGVSIAVINNGKLEWAKGYGVLEAGTRNAVTSETRFQAASISKPVAAMAALALVTQGKLSLDEDVNLKLKSWHVPDNEFTKTEKVTLRRLLSHSAGLTIHGFPGYAAGASVPTLTQILDGQKPPANTGPVRVDILPGKQLRYSGGGYTVLQQLMMDVTGKPFPDLMQEFVLSRIGMTRSTFVQPLPKELEAVAATGHRQNLEPIKGHWHTYPEMAAAGLWTTPSDLALFAIDLMESPQNKSNKVLSPEISRQMLTKQMGSYGLGVSIGETGGVTSFAHGGSNEGFTCILVAHIETAQGAVIMTNSDNGPPLFNEILRAISQEYNWKTNRPRERASVAIDPAILASYPGQYDANGTPVTVSLQSGQLSLQTPPMGPSPFKLYPSTEDRFFLQESEDFEVHFVKDSKGKVSELQIQAGLDKATATRVK
jgi:CubicO group peptidase (beta-lactamase class C family)